MTSDHDLGEPAPVSARPRSSAPERERARVLGNLRRGLVALLALFLVTSYVYTHIMPWSLVKALFFTLTTITTVGYNDYDLTDPAKLFTMAVIALGLVIWTFILVHLIELMIMGWQEWRHVRMEHKLAALEGHFVVIGYGLVGHAVAHWLRLGGAQVLVVDRKPDAVSAAEADGLLAIVGDATDEETLIAARLSKAAGLLAVTRSDPTNVFVTLTARGLLDDLHICAAAMAPGSESKLRRAGANAVVSPYDLGAHRLATAAVSPRVAELMAQWGETHQAGLVLREAAVEANSPVCGQSLRDTNLRGETGVLVAAVKSAASDALTISPEPDYVFQAGDVVIGFGLQTNMEGFLARLAPAASGQTAALRER